MNAPPVNADMVLTDPPYNMAYKGTAGARQKEILNDDMSEEDFNSFLQAVYNSMSSVMKNGASFYVFYKELGTGVFINALNESELTFKQELIWVKNSLVLGGSKYQSMYEPFLFGCKGKKVEIWNGNRNQKSVIEHIDDMNEFELRDALKNLLEMFDGDIIRENKSLKNDLHPTMKPIKLLAKLIYNSSNKNDTILDLFGGSGSTLIAAEQTGRNCRMIELDERYADVIVKRFENLTNIKAELI